MQTVSQSQCDKNESNQTWNQVRFTLESELEEMAKKLEISILCSTPVLLGVLLLCSRGLTQVQPVDRKLIDQPRFERFPWPDLKNLRDHGRPEDIRLHAWHLLEQLTQYDGVGQYARPIWENWYTKCSELQLSNSCSEIVPVGSDTTVEQGKIFDPTAPEPAKELPATKKQGQFSTVFYSPDIAKWILDNHLNDSKTLLAMFAQRKSANQTASATTSIAPIAPETSIVVKEIWEGVNPSASGSNSWTITYYDPSEFSSDQITLPLVSVWKHRINLITLSATGALDTHAPCVKPRSAFHSDDLNGPIAANCFVFRYEPEHCFKLLPSHAPKPGTNAELQPDRPCLFVLMGVQIMTRENLENWTWNTYWWGAIPRTYRGKDKSVGRPQSVGAGFQNFFMDTLLSKDGDPSVQGPFAAVFNPYLEGPTPMGRRSNCLACHYKASYIPQNTNSQSRCQVESRGPRNGLTNVTRLIADSSLGTDCSPQLLSHPVDNQCRLRTSFLWSLTTNQDCDSTVPFQYFIHKSKTSDSGRTAATNSTSEP
jgi:hypothetical protein